MSRVEMESDTCTTDEEINNNTEETENTDSDYKDFGKEDHEVQKSSQKHVDFDFHVQRQDHVSEMRNLDVTDNLSLSWNKEEDQTIVIEKLKKEKRLQQEKLTR